MNYQSVKDFSVLKEKPTIAFLIPSLQTGGAERQLIELVKGIDKKKWHVLVLTMYEVDKAVPLFSDDEKISFLCLKKSDFIIFLYRLCRILRTERVVLLHAFLLTAQFYAILARMVSRKVKLVFGVRDSLNKAQIKNFKDILCQLFVFDFSFLVNLYVFNSHAGKMAKEALIPYSKQRVIFNGIDTEKFRPNNLSRNFLRQCIGADLNTFIIGIVANFSHYKDYRTFILSAKFIAEIRKDVHFVAIGENRNDLGDQMTIMVKELAIGNHFHFMGLRTDVENLIVGMDVLCSSSITEGFSNSICEAMACGVPCVVTDVGDASFIVDDTGVVVPPGMPDKLANAIINLLSVPPEERKALGQAARQRILNEFSVSKMIRSHEETYENVLNN